jgi:hypothetical protein
MGFGVVIHDPSGRMIAVRCMAPSRVSCSDGGRNHGSIDGNTTMQGIGFYSCSFEKGCKGNY